MRPWTVSGISLSSTLFSRSASIITIVGCCVAALVVLGARAQTEGATVGGIVVDEVSSPVAGAKVTISFQDFTSSILTQNDGKFDFRKLAPGQYRITVEAAGFRREAMNVSVPRSGDPPSQIIRLRASSLHILVLNTTSRQPLSGVVLSLSQRDSTAVGALPSARSVTEEGGEAYFGRLAPGSYQISAALRGYDEYRGEVFISPGRVTTDFTLPLSVAPIIPFNEKAISRYSVPNIPSKNVQAIFQDSNGYVWLGTERGLARFDGSSFMASGTIASEYAGLSGLDIRSIAEDKGGALLLATRDGVHRITKEGEALGRLLAGVDVRKLFVDSKKNVWIASSNGVFVFDGQRMTSFDRTSGLSSEGIRSIQEDLQGSLWIASSNGVDIFDGSRVTRFDRLQADRDASAVRDLFIDRAGSVWIATAGGLLRFNGNELTAVRSDSALSDLKINVIGQDRNGRLWFGLDAGGALLYDSAGMETQRLWSLDRDRINTIFTDREGNTWFGTDNGAVRADLYSFVNFNTSRGLADNDVRVITQTRGRLWFGTAAGLSRLEGERLMPVEGFRGGISVRSVAFDNEAAAWFATDQGVFKSTGQAITQLNESNGLSSNNVRWVLSAAGGSMMIFATSKGVNFTKDRSVHSLDQLSGFDVRHVFEDSDGRLWFSTNRGAVSYDLKASRFEVLDTGHGVADNDVRWITRFGDKLILATHAGAQSFGMDAPVLGRQSSQFAIVDSEPATALFVDRDGFLWVGSENGDVKKFVALGGYLVPTGYSSETYALTGRRINSISEDAEGRIWIATDAGAVRHTPLRIEAPTHISLEMDGRQVQPTGSSYELPSGRHRLTFRISGISMSGQVRYLYRINPPGEESSWALLPLQQGVQREVPVFDVGEGLHAFEVLTLNRDLYGSPITGSRPSTITVMVAAPFWKRGWFLAVAVTVAGLIVAAAIVFRRWRDREFLLPKPLRTYVPIEPNPFIVGNPIRTEKMFYGREDDFKYVQTKLEGVSQGVVIVFCGDRRVGKSSILYQVMNGRLGERFIPVFIDMQEMVIASDSEFFLRITRLMQDALGLRGLAGRVETPVFDGLNPYPVFIDFLDEILKLIRDKTLLILIDEYELMESKVDEGKLSPELFTFLAGLMDNKERLALIFTGSRRLEERDRKYWRELLRRSLFRKVGFLSPNDARRLVVEPVADRVAYGRGTVDRIYRLTSGQPFYTQVICQNAVDYLNEHKQNWVSPGDLEKSVDEILDNPLPQMIYSWGGLSDDEKLVLSLLAEALSNSESYATAAVLRTLVHVNDYPVQLSENSIRLTLEELLRREMTDKDSSEGFRFKMDLFRLWIRKAHSIWQVLNEVRTH